MFRTILVVSIFSLGNAQSTSTSEPFIISFDPVTEVIGSTLPKELQNPYFSILSQLNKVNGISENIPQSILDAIQNFTNSALALALSNQSSQLATASVQSALTNLDKFVDSINGTTAQVQSQLQTLGAALDALNAYVTKARQQTTGIFGGIFSGISSFFTDALKNLQSSITNILKNAATVGAVLQNSANSSAANLTALSQNLTNAAQSVSSALRPNVTAIASQLQSLLSSSTGPGTTARIQSLLSQLQSLLANAPSADAAALKPIIDPLVSSLTNALSSEAIMSALNSGLTSQTYQNILSALSTPGNIGLAIAALTKVN